MNVAGLALELGRNIALLQGGFNAVIVADGATMRALHGGSFSHHGSIANNIPKISS